MHTIGEYFKDHIDESGSSLSIETHAFRYRVTETFLGTGTPMHRCNEFRPLLERIGLRLSSASNLSRVYIPRIHEIQTTQLKAEMEGQLLSIIFDGTTRLGEATNMVGRWCSSDFYLFNRLIMFRTTEKHMDASQLASLITSRIAELSIPYQNVVSITRDSCATNGAACKLMLGNPFINACDLLCVSHTISNAGSRIQLSTLNEFTTPWLDLVCGRDPHPAAKRLWKELVSPQAVPGYSKVRWWSKAEIWFVVAENYDKLRPFVRLLQQRDIGDATTAKLASILHEKAASLQLELAAILDIRPLVRATYELEGDRLELLLVHRRIEVLRVLGREIKANKPGVLPNLDAVLRSQAKLEVGLQIEKVWPVYGVCTGKVVSSGMIESSLYPGRERMAYKVRYDIDGEEEDLEEEELRPLICTPHLRERVKLAEAIYPAFEYLEKRFTGNCEPIYDCSSMYDLCSQLQIFDPSYGAEFANAECISKLSLIAPLKQFADLAAMKAQLPHFVSLACNVVVDYSDVQVFSDQVLTWWRKNGSQIPAWARAAQIVFAMTPNSAGCERVFAALRHMYGDAQLSSLSDQIEAALMLRCNKRQLG